MRTLVGLVIAFATAVVPSTQPSAAQASNAAVCALFSADDAAKIMGGAMKPRPNMGATVCMYELTEGSGTAGLTVTASIDKAAEDLRWASIKETRHLQVGQKNTKPLPGVGDEAWFTGNLEKGKAGVSSIIARKGNANFAIDVMTFDYRASPEAMTAIAKRVASQL
ncbi:MAG TPA: hypothetical protein VKH42_20565 [Vicinamibacterales bacterium]|nr:hypothetical protein [Vicinamibacterales bacterium]